MSKKRLLIGTVWALDKGIGEESERIVRTIKGMTREQAYFLEGLLRRVPKGYLEDEAYGFFKEEDGSYTYGTVFLKNIEEIPYIGEKEMFRKVNMQILLREVGEPYYFILE